MSDQIGLGGTGGKHTFLGKDVKLAIVPRMYHIHDWF